MALVARREVPATPGSPRWFPALYVACVTLGGFLCCSSSYTLACCLPFENSLRRQSFSFYGFTHHGSSHDRRVTYGFTHHGFSNDRRITYGSTHHGSSYDWRVIMRSICSPFCGSSELFPWAAWHTPLPSALPLFLLNVFLVQSAGKRVFWYKAQGGLWWLGKLSRLASTAQEHIVRFLDDPMPVKLVPALKKYPTASSGPCGSWFLQVHNASLLSHGILRCVYSSRGHKAPS